ncbi:MAG: MFS transporter [Chloroflexi bacterium]|nr:MFS transporter [Chloroflexota bacterium]
MNLQYIISNHRTFFIFLATIVLMEIAHGVELIALFPLYLNDQMHEGADAIGVTLSSYLIADILARTPAGWAADRWARKPVLLIGVALSALPILLMPRVESQSLFLFLNIVNGIGAGCIWPAIYAGIADVYGRERYGLVLGIVNMVMLGGIAIGPIAGGFLLGHVNYETAFVICFVIVMIAFVLVVAFVREARTHQAVAHSELQSFRTVLGQLDATLTRLLVIGLLLTFALGMMLPLISLFGKQVMNLTPDQFALILIPPSIITAALIIPAGQWADRHGRQLPLILGLILVAIPFAGAPLSINPLIVTAGATVAGIGYALLVPAWNALVMEYVPANARGLFLGAIATAQGIGLAVGPFVGGELWERVHVYAPFEIAALFLFGATIIAVMNARMTK